MEFDGTQVYRLLSSDMPTIAAPIPGGLVQMSSISRRLGSSCRKILCAVRYLVLALVVEQHSVRLERPGAWTPKCELSQRFQL